MSGWPYTVICKGYGDEWTLLNAYGTGDRFVVVDFFNHLNMLYGTVTEFCTVHEVRYFYSSLFTH